MTDKYAILALDYYCLKYMMYFRGTKYWNPCIHGFKPEVLAYWLRSLQTSVNNVVAAVENHAEIPVKIVGLIDCPWPAGGYWRSQVYLAQQQALQEQGLEALHFKIKKQETPDTAYKGNRLAEGSYTEFLKLCHQLLYELPYPVLKYPGLEADDFWGLITRDAKTPVYGATLDHDWALCTAHSPQVYWVNLHRSDYLGIYNQDTALSLFQKSYKKAKFLSEIPQAKSLKGERSDNLGKGFDPRLADLVQFSAPSHEIFANNLPNLTPWDFSPAHGQVKDLLKNFNE
jgi:hypothetical protein